MNIDPAIKDSEALSQALSQGVRRHGVTTKFAAEKLRALNLVLEELENTDPKFRAVMEAMRFRCLPWYKKLWIKIRGLV